MVEAVVFEYKILTEQDIASSSIDKAPDLASGIYFVLEEAPGSLR